jgi:hypothetical protein
VIIILHFAGGAKGTRTLIPCLQSDVSARCGVADLARQLSISNRQIPLPTLANGTLMAM